MKKQALNLMEPEKKEELRNIAVEWEQYEDEVLEEMLKEQLRTFHAKHAETNAETMTHQSRSSSSMKILWYKHRNSNLTLEEERK